MNSFQQFSQIVERINTNIETEAIWQQGEQEAAKKEYRDWCIEHDCMFIAPTYQKRVTHTETRREKGTEIVIELKRVFNMKDGRSRASKLDYTYVTLNVDFYRQYASLSQRAYEMVTGIIWAYETGRLIYEAEKMIRGMNALAFVRLVGQVSDNCTVQGEIPKYLNSKLS